MFVTKCINNFVSIALLYSTPLLATNAATAGAQLLEELETKTQPGFSSW